jgi:hypothetical protein
MTISAPATQVQSDFAAGLIADVERAAWVLDSAIDELVRSLQWLDDDDVPADVRDVAAATLSDAEVLRSWFDDFDFSGKADEMERLVEKADDGETQPALPLVRAV